MIVDMSPSVSTTAHRKNTGIAQVVVNWTEHLNKHGIKIVEEGEKSDVTIGHSASRLNVDIHVSHGLLWTGEFPELSNHDHAINRNLVYAAIHARRVIVPSEWVANVYRRDLRMNPHVIRHGINWDDWQHDKPNGGYVLWAKNRVTDGLDPSILYDIALAYPKVQFKTTYANFSLPNVDVLGGAIPFEDMQNMVQRAAVLIMSDRETWGIAAAEALAAGTPVLSVRSGSVPHIVEHGVSGYCYHPGSVEDAIQGLKYCLNHRDALGQNGREYARHSLTWHDPIKQIAQVIREVAEEKRIEAESFENDQPPPVDVIITSHNFGHSVGRAIDSALSQTYPIGRVLVVDDSSVVRRYIVQLLEHQYIQTVQAVDGEQGLALLKNDPDITFVVTDHDMPHKDGISMIREVRQHYTRNQLAILGLSASDDRTLTAQFLKAGANDFLYKPFNQEEFFCRIHQLLDMKEANNELFRHANEDALTGLWNRRFLFNQACKGCEKRNIAMMDIDFFKLRFVKTGKTA